VKIRVLHARAPLFEVELLGLMKKKPTQHIKIEDMEPSIFEMLLHFIYTDSLLDDYEASGFRACHFKFNYILFELKSICEFI
jgi:hypothetical protein